VLRSGWVSPPPVFWIFMEQGKIMEAEAPTVWVGATPTGLTVPHNPLRFFTGRMPFLPPSQQRQSTEGTDTQVRQQQQQQLFNGFFSGTTQVSRYRKKHSALVQSCAAFRLGFPTSCLLDFYGAVEDNGGRGTDSLGGP